MLNKHWKLNLALLTYLPFALTYEMSTTNEQTLFKVVRGKNEKVFITNQHNQKVNYEHTIIEKENSNEHTFNVPVKEEAQTEDQYIKLNIIQN